MRRRDFIKGIVGSAATWPLSVRAQQRDKLPLIGFLGATTPALASERVAAFTQRLKELGWIEDRTVKIEYRWAEGDLKRSPEIIAEFVRLKVNVIVTHATENVMAAKRVTSVIPIVFAAAGDPIGTDLVASLAHPGGNVAGLSIQATDLATKRLQLLREVVPDLRRLAILVNVNNPASVLERREVQTAARKISLEVISLELRNAEDIAPAFKAVEGRAQVLYVIPDALVSTNRARIHTLAMGVRLPTMYASRDYVEAGRTIRTCSGAPPSMSTKFCAAPSRAIFQ